jgi:zinc protease
MNKGIWTFKASRSGSQLSGERGKGACKTVNFDFQEGRLSNGLHVLALRDPSLPVVTFQIHFAAGSRNEKPGITGISHLFEHMMFRGSKELGPEEFSRIIQANGGSSNAFTTADNTSYFENLPADKLELAMRLEAERLQNLKITKENLATEREVVRSERKYRSVNSPYGLAVEQLFAAAYHIHPYRWPVVGLDQDLKDLTLENCLEYYRIHYAPNNAVIGMVGDFEVDRALSLAEKYFGGVSPQPEPPPVQAREIPQRGERRILYKKVAQVPAFFVGFHIPAITDPDIYPLLVLASLLSHGKSSRFYQRFIKTGRAVEADVDLGPPPFLTRDPGLLVITVIASPQEDIKNLERDLWEEIDRVRGQPIDEAELEKSKKKLWASYLMGLETHLYKGIVAGLYQIRAGDYRWINRVGSAYEAVAAEDLVRVVDLYLNEDNRTVVHVVPVSERESKRWGEYE